jgi:hypothetical protein
VSGTADQANYIRITSEHEKRRQTLHNVARRSCRSAAVSAFRPGPTRAADQMS